MKLSGRSGFEFATDLPRDALLHEIRVALDEYSRRRKGATATAVSLDSDGEIRIEVTLRVPSFSSAEEWIDGAAEAILARVKTASSSTAANRSATELVPA